MQFVLFFTFPMIATLPIYSSHSPEALKYLPRKLRKQVEYLRSHLRFCRQDTKYQVNPSYDGLTGVHNTVKIDGELLC
jgi:hypothetical protein